MFVFVRYQGRPERQFVGPAVSLSGRSGNIESSTLTPAYYPQSVSWKPSTDHTRLDIVEESTEKVKIVSRACSRDRFLVI